MAISGKGRGGLVADRRYGAARTAAKTPSKAVAKPAAKASAAKSGRGFSRRPPPRGFLARFVGFIWRIIWGTFWRLGVVGATVVGLSVAYFHSTLPPVSDLLDGRARGSVTMLDRDGEVYAWRGETFGGQISSESVAPDLRNAVIATEDKRFYQHFGVSPRGIASAISINLAAGRGPLEGNGGSTITQQVAKLLCLGVPYVPADWKSEADYEDDCRGGGIWRKVKEIPYALAMEVKYSKADILTIYFNRVYLGAGARGFEAAAQRYFGQSAATVNPAEAAMLAGLLKAPSKYAPTNNLQVAQDRAAVIIGLMREQGYLTEDQAADALTRPAELSKAAAQDAGGFFADWVMETAPPAFSSETTEDVIIRTTLDPALQKATENALADVLAEKLSEGSDVQIAVVVMSADGAVRAMIGGRQSEQAGSFNRATQALRQTGSSFKPFVYATALDLGYSPMDLIDDSPMTLNIPGSGPWSPDNYDNEYKGVITLTQALAESRNIPAVRLSEAVGRDLVRSVAAAFGIQSDLAAGPALALGASEATLVEMTGAYAGILNGGSSVTPYGMVELRLQGDSEPLFNASGGIGERVISEHAARQLTWMMQQVIDTGTGGRAQLADRPAAGKTGTTTAARDAWFIGFTADYVAGVWMGYDDNTPLKGVTGGGLPAEIWQAVMTRVNEGLPARELPADPPDPPQVSVATPAPGGAEALNPEQFQPVEAIETAPQGNGNGNGNGKGNGKKKGGFFRNLFGGGN